jgi:hypothetical protein
VKSSLKLNLKRVEDDVPTVNPIAQLLQSKLKQNVGLHPHSKIEDEQRIVELADQIDEQIVMLDNRLDMVLENHEKDFLSAYRLHMVRVQQELTELKTRGTEAQLQLK